MSNNNLEFVGNTGGYGDCLYALIKNVYRFYKIPLEISMKDMISCGYRPALSGGTNAAVQFNRFSISLNKKWLKTYGKSWDGLFLKIRENLDKGNPVGVYGNGLHIYMISKYVCVDGQFFYQTVNRGSYSAWMQMFRYFKGQNPIEEASNIDDLVAFIEFSEKNHEIVSYITETALKMDLSCCDGDPSYGGDIYMINGIKNIKLTKIERSTYNKIEGLRKHLRLYKEDPYGYCLKRTYKRKEEMGNMFSRSLGNLLF